MTGPFPDRDLSTQLREAVRALDAYDHELARDCATRLCRLAGSQRAPSWARRRTAGDLARFAERLSQECDAALARELVVALGDKFRDASGATLRSLHVVIAGDAVTALRLAMVSGIRLERLGLERDAVPGACDALLAGGDGGPEIVLPLLRVIDATLRNRVLYTALGRWPNAPELWNTLGGALLAASDHDAAEAAFERSLEAAIRCACGGVAADPLDASGEAIRATAMRLERTRFEAASIRSLFAPPERKEPGERVGASLGPLVNLTILRRKRHGLSAAREALRRLAPAASPVDRARAHVEADQPDEAVRTLLQAIEEGGPRCDGYLAAEIGRVLHASGRIVDAVALTGLLFGREPGPEVLATIQWTDEVLAGGMRYWDTPWAGLVVPVEYSSVRAKVRAELRDAVPTNLAPGHEAARLLTAAAGHEDTARLVDAVRALGTAAAPAVEAALGAVSIVARGHLEELLDEWAWQHATERVRALYDLGGALGRTKDAGKVVAAGVAEATHLRSHPVPPLPDTLRGTNGPRLVAREEIPRASAAARLSAALAALHDQRMEDAVRECRAALDAIDAMPQGDARRCPIPVDDTIALAAGLCEAGATDLARHLVVTLAPQLLPERAAPGWNREGSTRLRRVLAGDPTATLEAVVRGPCSAQVFPLLGLTPDQAADAASELLRRGRLSLRQAIDLLDGSGADVAPGVLTVVMSAFPRSTALWALAALRLARARTYKAASWMLWWAFELRRLEPRAHAARDDADESWWSRRPTDTRPIPAYTGHDDPERGVLVLRPAPPPTGLARADSVTAPLKLLAILHQETSGTPEAAAVVARFAPLERPRAVLEAYAAIGRVDLAIEHLERRLVRSITAVDRDARGALADAYLRADRHLEALLLANAHEPDVFDPTRAVNVLASRGTRFDGELEDLLDLDDPVIADLFQTNRPRFDHERAMRLAREALLSQSPAPSGTEIDEWASRLSAPAVQDSRDALAEIERMGPPVAATLAAVLDRLPPARRRAAANLFDRWALGAASRAFYARLVRSRG